MNILKFSMLLKNNFSPNWLRLLVFIISISIFCSNINCNQQENNKNKTNNISSESKPFSVELSKEKSEKLQKDYKLSVYYFNNQQYDKFVDFLYPPMLEEIMKLNNLSLLEAKKVVTEMTKKEIEEGESKGFKIKKIELVAISNTYIGFENRIYTALSNSVMIEYKGKQTTKLSKTIGISLDNGENWYFIEYNEGIRNILLKEMPETAFNVL
ncbi:MAG: hypothetical protein ACOYPR_02145 [Saprospiraceae bacterium]